MTRSLSTLLALSLVSVGALSASPVQAQQAPSPAAKVDEARGAARVLLEQAAFEEEHERDYERAMKLFERARARAKEAGAPKLLARAEASLERCRTKRGEGAPDALPTSAYQLFDRDEILLYGDRLVPALLQAIRTGTASDSEGKDHKVSPSVAARLLCRLETPGAARALDQLLASRDPVMRITIVRELGPHNIQQFVKALRDPVPAVRDEAIGELDGYSESEWDPQLGEGLRRALLEGAPRALWPLRKHPKELGLLVEHLLEHPEGFDLKQVVVALDKSLYASRTLEPSAVRALLRATGKRGSVSFLQSQFFTGLLKESSWELTPAIRRELEAKLLEVDLKRNPKAERLLKRVAGRATIEKSLTTPQLSRVVTSIYANLMFGDRLEEHRLWLSQDLRRLGSAKDWSRNLKTLCAELATTQDMPIVEERPGVERSARKSSTDAAFPVDAALLGLFDLTLRRFGPREGARILLRSICPGALSAPDPALEGRLGSIHPMLPLVMGIGTSASYARCLESPKDENLDTSRLWPSDAASLSAARVLEIFDGAHPSQRQVGLRFALNLRQLILRRAGKSELRILERGLVARLTRAGRVDHAAQLLETLYDDQAWIQVARGEVAHVSTATAGPLAETVMGRSEELAVEVLPRAYVHLLVEQRAYAEEPVLGSKRWLKRVWNKLCTRFPIRTEASAGEAYRLAQEACQGRGPWRGITKGSLSTVIRILVGEHPRGYEIYRAAVESGKAPQDLGVAIELLERIGKDLPPETLDFFMTQPQNRYTVLEVIRATRYLKGVDYAERELSSPNPDLRERARKALEELGKSLAEQDLVASIKTGLKDKELRDLAALLKDENEDVACGAALALGRLRNTAALPVLVRALRRAKSPKLKEAVLKAIESLTPGPEAKTPKAPR